MPRKRGRHKKSKIEIWHCDNCNFEWNYRTIRCPICSSEAKSLLS